jgi:hypothetical protein
MAQISVSFFININFDDSPSALTFLLFFIKYRSHLFARIAPRRAKLHHVMIFALDRLIELLEVLDLRVKPFQKVKVSQKHFN